MPEHSPPSPPNPGGSEAPADLLRAPAVGLSQNNPAVALGVNGNLATLCRTTEAPTKVAGDVFRHFTRVYSSSKRR